VGRGGRALLAAAAALALVGVAAPPAYADAVRDAQWHLDYLNVTRAHRITQGAGVTVAVIDTGVDAGHPDLAGAVLAGTDLTATPVGKRDGRTDLDGHGTAMAGLVVARGHGSNRGALGIAPRARVLPIRNREFGSVGGITGLPESIEWAVSHGARVISMSVGVPDPDEQLRAAVEAARRADVVLVAAVGNRPLSQAVEYPAGFPGVLAVGGIDRRGAHADVSVTGPEVTVAAPAVDVVSTDKRGDTGYTRGEGTSGATAIVAGAAALVRARYPDLSAAEVVHRLTATARDAGDPGRDQLYGFGILNLVAALTADVPPPTAEATTAAPAPAPASPAAPGRDPVAEERGIGAPMGLLLVGLGCLLLVGLAAGAGGWLLLRRRQA
jgi:type VII secretion-associated serine protease mycosin